MGESRSWLSSGATPRNGRANPWTASSSDCTVENVSKNTGSGICVGGSMLLEEVSIEDNSGTYSEVKKSVSVRTF
jgi:hypothetical protein